MRVSISGMSLQVGDQRDDQADRRPEEGELAESTSPPRAAVSHRPPPAGKEWRRR